MFRALACAAISVALPSYALVATDTTPVDADVVHYAPVHQIICDEGKGSGVLTDRGWVSAAHVTDLSACTIDGIPIQAASAEEDLDFSTIRVPLRGRSMKVSCEGFKPGHWYFAVGFAGGVPWQTMTRHLATYKTAENGLRLLLGAPTVIPGMSGGAFMNERGEIVGIVNAYSKFFPASFSRALADTSLCKDHAHA